MLTCPRSVKQSYCEGEQAIRTLLDKYVLMLKNIFKKQNLRSMYMFVLKIHYCKVAAIHLYGGG